MRFITQILRFIVGGLFIFSGLIKLNDPLGFSYKLDEYFSVDVLNLTFLQPHALSLSVAIVIAEVLLGVALIIGFWKKLTSWLLLLMILFFTFLTFYSAYFNKVTDCGCFGDAIPLTPWESFGKDVVLSVFIVLLFVNQKYIYPWGSKAVHSATMGLTFIACAALGFHVLNHLPVLDFRAYATGKNIIEGMKSAEELGLQPTVYQTIFTLENGSTGASEKVPSDRYSSEKWWEKKDWKINSDLTESIVAIEGYEPPVHDFVIVHEDRDITDSILSMDAILLVISYKIELADEAGYEAINTLVAEAEIQGVPTLGLSASFSDDVEEMRHRVQAAFPYATMDETALKTIVRANPGVVLLKKATIMAKYHPHDIPAFSELKANFLD